MRQTWTREEMEILWRQAEHCKRLLKGMGICPSEEIGYTFGDYRQYGTYSKRDSERTISVNHTYFKYAVNHNIEILNNTLIHEMLHDVANDMEFRCGHRGAWRRLAKLVSDETQYRIQTHVDKEFERDYLIYLSKTSQNNFNSNKAYYVICQDCGKVLTVRQKKTKVVDGIMRNSMRYSCGICKSHNLIVDYK